MKWLSLLLVELVGTAGCQKSLGHPRPAAYTSDRGQGMSLHAPIDLLTEEDAVVRVVGRGLFCSGTLVSDDLVLTAHHCVVEHSFDEALPFDVAPEQLHVELGGGHWPWARADVKAVIAPPCGYRSGHGDIAILVLSRKLIGVPTMRLRLDGPAEVGERVEVIGYGRCSGSEPGVARVHRFGGKVLKVGPSAFWAEAAMCDGDSGGPAVNPETGQVIGVASAAEMDDDDRSADPAFFTRLGIWRPLFSAATAVAAGRTPAEVQPIEGCPLP